MNKPQLGKAIGDFSPVVPQPDTDDLASADKRLILYLGRAKAWDNYGHVAQLEASVYAAEKGMLSAGWVIGIESQANLCNRDASSPGEPEQPITARIEPLTLAEIKEQSRLNDGWITGVVTVDLSDVIDTNLEGFLDVLSELLTGTEALQNIQYEVVGHERDILFVRVSGESELVEQVLE